MKFNDISLWPFNLKVSEMLVDESLVVEVLPLHFYLVTKTLGQRSY